MSRKIDRGTDTPKLSVSRETDTDLRQATPEDWSAQADEALLAITRRTALGLRRMLEMWEAAVVAAPTPHYEEIHNGVRSAIDILEGLVDPIR